MDQENKPNEVEVESEVEKVTNLKVEERLITNNTGTNMGNGSDLQSLA